MSPHAWTGRTREQGDQGWDLSAQNWNKQVREKQAQTSTPKPSVVHSGKFGAFNAELRINKIDLKRGKIPF